MNYASAIHQCRSAAERNTATAIDRDVSRANKYRPPVTAEQLRERLQETIEQHRLRDVEIHHVPLNGRVDVLVNGRTLISWTPLQS